MGALAVVIPSPTVGALLDTQSGKLIPLAGRALIGRSRGCSVTIDDPRASAEHAVISWSGEQWEIRDLGSSNGTWVDGRRLAVGQRTPLRLDSRLGFGSADDRWLLADDRPGGAAPPPGHLDLMPKTLRAEGPPLLVANVSLCFAPSLDEEHVELEVHSEEADLLLPSRSCHYMLLTLARSRIQDAHAGVAEAEQGWTYSSDLADMLGYTAERLNIEIFRARSLFAKLGFVDAARLIERRPSSRQIRLGVSRVHVTRGRP
jgi:hypothetical protein